MSREMPCKTLPLVPLNAAADEQSLAHDMIEVHGAEAAAVARANARTAALAAQMAQAKSWIRILGIIQRRLTDKAISPGNPAPFPSIPSLTKDNGNVHFPDDQLRQRLQKMVGYSPARQR